jgi:CDP-glycerol:poly(glycerophosphate) glycerophosphotransferase
MKNRPPALRRWLSTPVRSFDRTIARLRAKQRILVEIRTPMHLAVLGPIIEALEARGNVDVRFTSEYSERIRPLVPRGRFLTHPEARWQRFDLYVNADPWGAVSLRRCAARVNFFHGVAGKYDLDRPVGLPLEFHRYDRVAFVNADRLRRYIDAQLVAPAQAALVGYPKLDRLATGRCDGEAALATLAFRAARPTALYAPTYSSASSLQRAGESIVMALARGGFNVIVKLHDRSFDADRRYNGGVDWRTRFDVISRTAPVRLMETADSSPWLAAADLMVTDHSSVGFEYLVLDRPLIVYDVPGLIEAARINPEKVSLLRSAATVVRSPDELARAATAALHDRARLSAARRRVAEEMFYDPGRATDRAVALVESLLRRSPRPTSDPVRMTTAARPEAR